MSMSSEFGKDSTKIECQQRIFGSSENSLIKTSLRHRGFMKVGQVLHLEGPYISINKLNSAVQCLQSRHRFLRSRLKTDPRKLDTFLMEIDNTLHLKTREIHRKREDHLNYWRREWKQHEKDTVNIGDGLAEFWLLQDFDDQNAENAPREIIVICEHCICDGVSLSAIAHELLLALEADDANSFCSSLEWPVTMENAIHRSLSTWGRFSTFSRFIFSIIHWNLTNTQNMARIPMANVDFQLNDMAEFCNTEIAYAFLHKEDTQKLINACHQNNVTVTAAIASATLCTLSSSVDREHNHDASLTFAIAADTRRRCVPIVSNNELSYQVSGIMAFTIPARNIQTSVDDMWRLANTFRHHITKAIENRQILALGMIMGKFYEKSMGNIDLARTPTCGISNWGTSSFHEQYGQWKLVSVTPMGNLVRAPLPFVLIQTVNGILTIGFIGAAPLISLSTLETLCEETLKKIEQMIQHQS